MADRKAAAEFLEEDGQMDWRKRVDAAFEALEQAKSDRRWGRNESALENALKAAQLMPPASKDFDTPPSPAGSSNEKRDGNSKEMTGSEQRGDVKTDARLADESGSEDTATQTGEDANSELQVSNAEVVELRGTLEDLLESLDGKAGRGSGRSRSGLSFETDAIEIR
ncbi:MAG: hypothetical protein AB8B91_12520 [Rubripirellula sp.]